MNAESIRKEIKNLKESIPFKQDDLSIFDRIRLYEEIFNSPEMAAYKKAIAEGDEKAALDIYNQIPEDQAELFLHCYDRIVNYFDKLDVEVNESDAD